MGCGVAGCWLLLLLHESRKGYKSIRRMQGVRYDSEAAQVQMEDSGTCKGQRGSHWLRIHPPPADVQGWSSLASAGESLSELWRLEAASDLPAPVLPPYEYYVPGIPSFSASLCT